MIRAKPSSSLAFVVVVWLLRTVYIFARLVFDIDHLRFLMIRAKPSSSLAFVVIHWYFLALWVFAPTWHSFPAITTERGKTLLQMERSRYLHDGSKIYRKTCQSVSNASSFFRGWSYHRLQKACQGFGVGDVYVCLLFESILQCFSRAGT